MKMGPFKAYGIKLRVSKKNKQKTRSENNGLKAGALHDVMHFFRDGK